MRTCIKCKIEKELIGFPKDKNQVLGYSYKCKNCYKLSNKNYYEQNKNKYSDYYSNNKKSKKQYYKENSSKYNTDNKEKIKEYRKQNREYHKLWIKNKRKNDINFKIRHTLQTRLNNILKNKKQEKTSILLGETIHNIKQYLEKQFKPEMNWENHGEVWEIDHIKPCALFNLSILEQQKQCFHYTNLQPLFKTTEIAKSFGYIDEIGNKNKKDKYA
jgi:hypothetical protein